MKTGWYSFEFKRATVQRARAGASIPALSKELGVHNCQIYRWLRTFEEGGEEGLHRRGRTRPTSRMATPREPTDPEKRIAELERKIGQQAVDLDFLERAFKRVKESQPNTSGIGATASTK